MRRRALPEVLDKLRLAEQSQLYLAASDRKRIRGHKHEIKLNFAPRPIQRNRDDVWIPNRADSQLSLRDPSGKLRQGGYRIKLVNHDIGILSPPLTRVDSWAALRTMQIGRAQLDYESAISLDDREDG